MSVKSWEFRDTFQLERYGLAGLFALKNYVADVVLFILVVCYVLPCYTEFEIIKLLLVISELFNTEMPC